MLFIINDMRNMMKLITVIALIMLTVFVMEGCEKSSLVDDPDDKFVPVTNITGVNTVVPVGTVFLGGKVVPNNATNQVINWSVVSGGDIEGSIKGNNLTTKEEGFVVVMATVEEGIAKGENYTKRFTISIEPFVAVTYIVFEGPTYDEVGEIYLDAAVYPDDASYTDIVWSVKDAGRTRATIDDDILTTKAKGTVIISATIFNGAAEGKDYTEDFTIFIIDSETEYSD